MTAKSHNKKRNVGLLYEFLIKVISQSLVDGDKQRSTAALNVIKRYFKPGTELYREFRLINSLVRTTVSSESIAASIIQEAKVAARTHNIKQLDKEKSILISTINKSIKDDNFYDQHVNEYKIFATIHSLLNDWRSDDKNLGRQAQYEDQLLRWLTTDKSSLTETSTSISNESPGTARLLMKVMMKKLNEKYAGVLNDEQKGIIRAYAFSTANDNPESIRLKLSEIRTRLNEEIAQFMQSNAGDEYVDKKLEEALTRLNNEDLTVIDDAAVTRFMLYTKLSEELTLEES